MELMKTIENKRVLFITTKNLDYIRNSQEIDEISKISLELQVIGSNRKNYLFRVIYVYWKLLFLSLKNFDVCFVGFAPQLILPIWNWKIKRKYVVIDFFISMYDTFVFDRQKVSKKSLVAKVLFKIDQYTIKSADRVVADTKAHAEYFANEFSVKEEKISVMYLRADDSFFYPMKVEKRERILGKYNVLYFGSVLPLQGVEVVLDAVRLLKEEKSIFFTIIGPIKDKMQKVEQDNVEYIDWLSQTELAKYIAMSDLCLAGHFNEKIMKADRTIPGKAYIYRAMNKKMVLGDTTANHELFDDVEDVYFVERGSSEKLAELIKLLQEREK